MNKNKFQLWNRISALALICVFGFVITLTGVFSYTRGHTNTRVEAATSSNLNFQARLYSGSGRVVPDGYYNIEFKLHDALTGGSTLWTETRYDSNGVTAGNDNRVRVVNGYMSVPLGSVTALPNINWDQDLWITMNVGGSDQTATPTYDGEMAPRLKLTAVPFAQAAKNVYSGATNTASTNSDDVSVRTGNATGATSNSGNIAIDVGTATGTAGTISVGVANTSAISIGRTGVTTTNNGALTVTQLLTGNLGATISGAAISLNNNSNFATNINTGSSTGAVSIGNSVAGAIAIQSASTVGITSGTTLTLASGGSSNIILNSAGTIELQDSTNVTGSLAVSVTATGAVEGLRIESAGSSNILTVRDTTATAQDVFTISGTGAALFRNQANSLTAMNVQNAAGTSVFDVDTTNQRVGIGNAAPAYKLDVAGDINSTGVYRVSGTAGSTIAACGATQFLGSQAVAGGITTAGTCTSVDTSVTLQDAYAADVDGSNAIIALTTADDSLIIRNPAASGTDSGYTLMVENLATGAVEGLRIESAGSSNILTVRDTTATAQDVFTISGTGAALFRNQANSLTAMNVQNAAGTSVFDVDTTNQRVGIGNAAPAYKLDVAGDINSTGVYRVSGTAGSTIAACGATQFLGSQAVAGGITTAGTCTSVDTSVTLQDAYAADVDGSNAIIALTTADDSLIIRNPAASGTDSGYTLMVENLATGAVEGLRIESAGSSNILTVRDTTATAQDVFTISGTGAALFRNQANSLTAMNVQNAAGTSVFDVDTTNQRVGIGNAAPAYKLDVAGDINSTGVYRVSGTAGSTIAACGATQFLGSQAVAGGITTAGTCTSVDTSVTLQDAYAADVDGSNAIIALTTADDSLIIRNPAASGTDSGYTLMVENLATGAVEGLRIESAGSSNILTVRDTTATAQDVFTISGTGAALFRNQTNSTTAFQVQNAAGQTLFLANTTAQQVAIGPAAVPANGVLTVGTDTTVATGGIYFGTDTNLYRSAANTLITDDALTVAGLLTGQAGATISGAAINLNNNSNFATNINTGSSTGAVSIGNAAAGAIAIQSGSTLAVTATNFNLSTAGVVTLAGAQAIDVTTASAASSTAIKVQPGVSTAATGTGATLTLQGGNQSGTTTSTGGTLSLQGGNATGASGTRTGGNVSIDAGTGATANGNISIGTTNAAAISIGRTGVTTTNNGSLTVTQLGTFNTGLTVATGSTFTNASSTLLTAITNPDTATNTDIGTAATTVDVATTINKTQTTAGRTLTLPTPTSATSGRIIYINSVAASTQSFTMYGVVIAPNSSATFIWNGTAWIPTSTGGTGVNTIGTIDSQTKSANGAVISGSTVYLQTADATSVGLVSTTTQTFAGNKTFSGTVTVAQLLTGQAGATISGATIDLNASSNFATNINTGSSTGAVSIGNAAAGAISLQSGSTVGITSGTTLTLTSGGTSNIILNSAGTIELQDSTNVTGSLAVSVNTDVAGTLAVGTADALTIAATGNLVTAGTISSTNAGGKTTFTLTSTAADTGITIGGDTNLYRSAANTLATDDALTVTGLGTFNTGLTVATGSTFTNASSTLLTAITNGNTATDTDIGTAATTVDVATTINKTQTTAGRTLTLPTPTSATSGRIIYINSVAASTQSFTMYGVVIAPNSSATFIWNGTAWIPTSTGGTGVNTIGTIDSQTKSANGAVISGSTVYLQTADATSVGLVSTTTQTFAGNKTFSGTVTVAQLLTGQAGATISGATIDLNASSNFATNINTGSSTGAVSIGNAAAGAISLQSGSTVGITSGTTLTLTSGGTSNIILNSAGTIELQDSTNVTGSLAVSVNTDVAGTLAVGTADALTIAATGNLVTAGTISSTNAGGKTTFTLTSTAADTGITIGGDTNLYRSAANTLMTDDALTVAGLLTGQAGATISGAAINLNNNSNFATNINTGSSTGAVSIGNAAAGAIAIQSGSTLAVTATNFNLSTAGVVTLAGAQAIDVTTASAASSTAIKVQPGVSTAATGTGATLTLQGGDQSGTTTSTGGGLVLQAGNATGASGTRTGGNVTIDAGTGATANGSISIGTTNAASISIGRTGVTTTNNGSLTVTQLGTFNTGLTVATGSTFTNASSTLFTAVNIGNKPSGGDIGTAAATVDVATAFRVQQTTSGQTLSLPSPTVTTSGRFVTVSNNGSANFTMGGVIITPDTTAIFVWNGTAWTSAGIDGTGINYIQNQNTADQSANFRITGTGQANTGLLSPNLERATSGTLSIGTTANTTALSIGNTSSTFTAESNATANLFNGATAHTIQFGTGAAVQGITIGSTNSTSSLTLQAGTGNLDIGNDSVAKTTTINIGANSTGADLVAVGSAHASSTLILEGGTAANAIQIGNGATAHGIQIGTGAAAQTIVLGSTNTTSTTAIQGGVSGAINIGSVGASVLASTTNIANTSDATGTQIVSIGSGAKAANAVTLAAGATGGINLNSATIATNATTLALFNTNAATVTALQAGTSISLGATTGTLTVRNANQTFGNAAGSGLFTNNGATVNTTLSVANDSDGGALGGTPGTPLTAAQSVDVYTSISVNQTTAGQTITLPTPTASTAYGRILYISNIGTTSITLLGSTLNAGSTATLVWSNTNGGASWQYAGADGNAILNQNTADQSANFRITGTGQANTGLLSPNLERATSGTLSIGTTANTTALSIGNTGATFTAESNATANLFNGATAHTIQFGTGAAVQGITIGSTNSTSSLTLQAGTGNLDIGNDSVAKTTTINIGANSTGADLVAVGSAHASSTLILEGGTAANAIQIGNGATAHGIQIGTNATGDNDIVIGGTNAGSTVTIQGGTAAAAIQIGNNGAATGIQIGTGAGDKDIIIGSTTAGSSVIIQAASADGTQIRADGTNAFRIQSAGGTTMFNADVTTTRITIGGATTTLSTSNLTVSDVEITTRLRVGTATNGISFNDGTVTKLRFAGTAQNDVAITLSPEFPGAVLTGDGTGNPNVGTMTSDFCSNTSPVLNAGICAASGERHNYYSWTANATNDYDIFTRWQVPSDFAGWKASNPITFFGWRTSSSAGTSVTLTVRNSSGAVCGTATAISNTTTWSSTNYTIGSCSVTAGEVLILQTTLSVGVNGEFARIGEITLNYLSNF